MTWFYDVGKKSNRIDRISRIKILVPSVFLRFLCLNLSFNAENVKNAKKIGIFAREIHGTFNVESTALTYVRAWAKNCR